LPSNPLFVVSKGREMTLASKFHYESFHLKQNVLHIIIATRAVRAVVFNLVRTVRQLLNAADFNEPTAL
jgi:hypothetical protein